MNRSRLLPIAVVAAALAAPAAAQADSIVYIDGGNVVSASPDGSHKVQLTDGGDWHSVAQADDGTIAAAKGSGFIEILARDGRPLRSISTPPARTGNGGQHRGTPINLAFSPDGKTIAYEYFDVTCPPASSCPSEQHSVLYTSAEGPNASPIAAHGQQFGRQDPSFVSNNRALVFGGAGHGVNVDDLGGGDSSDTLWFTRETDFSDGEVTRDGTRFAVNVGYGDDTRIGFMITRGNPATGIPEQPQEGDVVCASDADAKAGGATWSPDGSAAAYESSAGIEIVRFSAFAPDNCGVAGSSVLSATGSQPDWGPADPPAKRFTEQVTTTPPPAAGAVKILVAGSVKRAKLRAGLKIKVSVPAAGPVTATLKKGAKTVATGTANAAAAGTVTVRLSAYKGNAKSLTVAVGSVTRKLTVR